MRSVWGNRNWTPSASNLSLAADHCRAAAVATECHPASQEPSTLMTRSPQQPQTRSGLRRLPHRRRREPQPNSPRGELPNLVDRTHATHRPHVTGTNGPKRRSDSWTLCARQRSDRFATVVSPPIAVRVDVVELQERALAAASAGLRDEGALAAIAEPHGALDVGPGRDATRRPDRPAGRGFDVAASFFRRRPRAAASAPGRRSLRDHRPGSHAAASPEPFVASRGFPGPP